MDVFCGISTGWMCNNFAYIVHGITNVANTI